MNLRRLTPAFSRAHLPILSIIAALALTAIVYWPGLNGPFVLDDGSNLEELNDWLTGRVGWLSIVFENDSGLLGRPLSMATFVANAALFGVDSRWFKFVNLSIHLVNGILVYLLFASLMRHGASTWGPERESRWSACLGAAIWLLHPLFASTVLYVVQRMAMLSALFSLLAMLAYLKGRDAWTNRRRRKACVFLGIVVPLCTALAALSKENGVLAPALCAVIELIVFRPAPGSRRGAWSKAFIGTVLVLPAIAAIMLTLARFPLITAGYSGRPFTLTERLLTETRVLWDYIGAIIMPGGPRLGLYHDDFPISHGLFDPATTLFAIGGWFAIIAIAWRLREIIPGMALGLGIFLVGQALESTVFPLMIYFEHRNYLPAIGAILAILSILTFAALRIGSALRHAAQIFGAAALILVAVLAAGTSLRAQVWTDQRLIVAQALLTHPNSLGARFDSIALAMYRHPPAIDEARKDADWLRKSTRPNPRRIGNIERALIDCTATAQVDPHLVQQVFDGQPGPYEEDLIRSFEMLSDRIGTHPCAGLSPGQMADELNAMLDRWQTANGISPPWRLRFRAANLYMAADRNADAIEQAKLAYYKGSPPTNAAIVIAGVLIDCGNTTDSSHILDAVEPRLRPSDYIAYKIIADDRSKIHKLEQSLSTSGNRGQ